MDILALRELAHGGVAEEDGRVDSSDQCDAEVTDCMHARHKSGVVPARLGEGQTDLVLLRVQIQRAAGLCRQWKS